MVVSRTLCSASLALAGVLVLGPFACGEGEADDSASSREASQDGPSASEARAVAEEGVAGGQAEEGAGKPPAVEPAGNEAPEGPTPEITRDTYTVRVDAPTALAQGEEGVTKVHVEPEGEWKMNHDFPVRLAVETPEGASVEPAEQSIDDVVYYSDDRGEWAIHFTPDGEGETNFEADFRFAVCTEAVCIPKREKLAWIVDVE